MTLSGRDIWRSTAASAWAVQVRRDPTIGRRCFLACCFRATSPGGSAWLNHYSVRTPMLALIGPRDGGTLDLDALDARLRDPAVRPVARRLGFETSMDLLGQYLGGPRALSAFAGQGPRNTDDYPFVTFDARRNVQALTAPPWALLRAVAQALRPDPTELLAEPKRDALSERLVAYWRARDRFLEARAALPR